MWSGGSNRRPPNARARRGNGRNFTRSATRPGYYPVATQAAPVKPRTRWPALRKLRQRVRALWRWVVVRAVRGWLGSRQPRSGSPAEAVGEVKQFPHSRWP